MIITGNVSRANAWRVWMDGEIMSPVQPPERRMPWRRDLSTCDDINTYWSERCRAVYGLQGRALYQAPRTVADFQQQRQRDLSHGEEPGPADTTEHRHRSGRSRDPRYPPPV